MSEMRMPSIEELAKIVYEYCKTNNISYIREDVLVKRIMDEHTQDNLQMLKENYNLDEGCGEDEESSNAILDNMVNSLLFLYRFSKRFYNIINVLIEECKADREKRDEDKFYYLTFYLSDFEIESIKLIRSSMEIFAKELYDYCKTNNIECMPKDKISSIINVDDDKIIDKVIEILIKRDMVNTTWLDNNYYIIFYLTENRIELNKNLRLMIEKYAEYILEYCNTNDITYIGKDELQRKMEIDDDDMFSMMLDYLVERHLADIENNDEDGKIYITIYE